MPTTKSAGCALQAIGAPLTVFGAWALLSGNEVLGVVLLVSGLVLLAISRQPAKG
jgi:hypothetical protein